jgi:quinol monooxygenase YgiN
VLALGPDPVVRQLVEHLEPDATRRSSWAISLGDLDLVSRSGLTLLAGHDRIYCPIAMRGTIGWMLIVCGHLVLDPADRDAHVAASVDAVRLARRAPGCLDFAVSADPVDPTRVNVFERWVGREALDAFRASGDPDDDVVDFSRIRRFAIEEYSVDAP